MKLKMRAYTIARSVLNSVLIAAFIWTVLILIPERILAANIVASGNCGSPSLPEMVHGDDAKFVLYDDGLLVVSGTGVVSNLAGILRPEKAELVKRCRIEPGITAIGDDGFSRLPNLITVDIPDTVTVIDPFAFMYSGLQELRIPDSITRIEESTFRGCSSLRTIEIPDSVNFIRWEAFYDCSSLETVKLPKKIKKICPHVFARCTSLREVSIPEGVTIIRDGAFYGCSSLEYLRIPAEARIDRCVFNKCNSLTIEYMNTRDTWNRRVVDPLPEGATLICHGIDIRESSTPDYATAELGKRVEYTIDAASDAGGLSYIWYYKDPGSEKFLKAAETSDTFGFTMTEAKNGRLVYCVVTDAEGYSATSRTITMRTPKQLRITKQPVDIHGGLDSVHTFSLTAEGDGTLKYQWYYQDQNDSNAHKSTNYQYESYETTFLAKRHLRKIYCIVTDGYGNQVKSDVVQIHVDPLITRQPESAWAPVGQLIRYRVEAEGEGLTYTWYYKNKYSWNYVKSTLTGPTYTTEVTSKRDGRQIYCIVTNAAGDSSKSDVVTMNVGKPVTITQQPTDQTVTEGDLAKFRVKAEGDGLTYTWYYRSVGKKSFTKSTQTGSIYSTRATLERDGRQIYCVITDSHGLKNTTEIVTLHVNAEETAEEETRGSEETQKTQEPQETLVSLECSASSPEN